MLVNLFKTPPPPINRTPAVLLAKADIRTLLKEGEVVFRFNRVTYGGSARFARGTTNLRKYGIPIPTGPSPARNHPDLIVYWDFDRRDWRSFYIGMLTYYVALPDGEDFFGPDFVRDLSPQSRPGVGAPAETQQQFRHDKKAILKQWPDLDKRLRSA